MIVTCPECHTEYRLDPLQLGAEGRKVSCVQCKHTWHQAHVPEKDIHAVMQEAVIEDEPEPLAYEPAEPAPPEDFDAILKQTAAAIAPAPKIPESVVPPQVMRAPAAPAPAVYKPMGVGTTQFGVLTFLLCCFISVSALFLAKGPVVRLWPAASLLYRTLGIPVRVPGEGLRLGSLIAENRIDKSGRVLVIEAQLSNMTEKPAPTPALRVTLSSAYGAALKTWTLDNKDAKPLAPGETAPVKLEFKDAPEGGTDIELKVVEP